MESNSPGNRVLLAPLRLLLKLAAVVRRVLGAGYQVLFHDKLSELDRQTERLGSASVESATYVGVELKKLDQRLERIERDIAALREQSSGRAER